MKGNTDIETSSKIANETIINQKILGRFIFKALLIASTLAIFPTMGNTSDTGIYYRPFNLVYATKGGKTIPEDDTTIINAFQSFPAKPTMITDVLLNAEPDSFASFISSLKGITPNLCFALGKKEDSLPADQPKLIALATKYSKYTTSIRIDHFQWLVRNSGDSAVNNYLTELHNLGFQNIMVNPWGDPQSGNGWHYVNAAQIGIDTSSWQADTHRIQHILAQSPNLTVVVNYENPGGQEALNELGPQGSINAMAVAADQQDTSYRWMPPWSHNYDPYQLNTLTWIANKLAEVDPEIGMEIAPLPRVYRLSQLYPNPAKQQVVMNYQLSERCRVSLRIYDITGKLVKTLVDEEKEAGYYRAVWDIRNNIGKEQPNAIYLCRLEAGEFKITKKLIVLIK